MPSRIEIVIPSRTELTRFPFRVSTAELKATARPFRGSSEWERFEGLAYRPSLLGPQLLLDRLDVSCHLIASVRVAGLTIRSSGRRSEVLRGTYEPTWLRLIGYGFSRSGVET
jgi:hypothetical protein